MAGNETWVIGYTRGNTTYYNLDNVEYVTDEDMGTSVLGLRSGKEVRVDTSATTILAAIRGEHQLTTREERDRHADLVSFLQFISYHGGEVDLYINGNPINLDQAHTLVSAYERLANG